jgi:hypothetical protein
MDLTIWDLRIQGEGGDMKLKGSNPLMNHNDHVL